MTNSTKEMAFCAEKPRAFRLHWLRFSMICLSRKPNARVFDVNSGHGPHSPIPGAAASSKRLTNVAYLQFATEQVWARIPVSEPSKDHPLYLVQGNLGPSLWHNQSKQSVWLQNRYRKHIPLLEFRCLLLSPAVLSNAGMAIWMGDVDLGFAKSPPPC